MKKSEFWEKIWIPVEKRQPPDSKKFVLIRSREWGTPMVVQASQALAGYNEYLNGNNVVNECSFSHWCFIGEPKNESI